MASTAYPLSGNEQSLAPIGEWIAKRGVLLLFLQMPVAALLVGYLLRLVSLPVAAFGVFVSFPVFTAWVSYRLTVSDDADEPVHQLHRYALYTLLPVVAFHLAQIPGYLAADVVYWQLWYDLGTQFTGEPSTEPWSFTAGVVVQGLVHMGLVMSYYVLFRRHSSLNATLFLGGTLSVLYLYLFPVFSLAGAQPGVAWYLTHGLATGVVVVSAWVMPAFWAWMWARLPSRALVAVLSGLAVLVTAPFGFAAERAANWQSGAQRRIDEAAFERVTVEARGPLTLTAIHNPTARYDFALTFDRPPYTSAAGLDRVVDAGPVAVEGRLMAADETVAWCADHVGELASPNPVRNPRAFGATAQRLQHVDIPVSCAGPAAAITDACAAGGVTIRWIVDAALQGDRTAQRRQFSGQAHTTLQLTPGSPCPEKPLPSEASRG